MRLAIAKLTTATNLSAGLVLEAYEVLPIDADPQFNTTQAVH
jgi:cellulose biosynthesis protein BcsQ